MLSPLPNTDELLEGTREEDDAEDEDEERPSIADTEGADVACGAEADVEAAAAAREEDMSSATWQAQLTGEEVDGGARETDETTAPLGAAATPSLPEPAARALV